MKEYVNEKEGGAPQHELGQLATGIQNEHHPSVWKEMIRQKEHIPWLNDLFEQTPEALYW